MSEENEHYGTVSEEKKFAIERVDKLNPIGLVETCNTLLSTELIE